MARRGEGKGGDEAKDKQKTPRIRPIGHQVHPDGYMSCPNLFFMWDTKYIRIAWLSESQAMMLLCVLDAPEAGSPTHRWRRTDRPTGVGARLREAELLFLVFLDTPLQTDMEPEN